jgi:hypothetical protein
MDKVPVVRAAIFLAIACVIFTLGFVSIKFNSVSPVAPIILLSLLQMIITGSLLVDYASSKH